MTVIIKIYNAPLFRYVEIPKIDETYFFDFGRKPKQYQVTDDTLQR